MRRMPGAIAALSVLFVAGAGTAHAATLKGQVVGSPYGSGAKTAIPVVLTRTSASHAHVSSPVALVVVAASKALPAPGGSVLPGNLRVGDSFSGAAKLSRATRRSYYPRLSLRSMKITKRSATLSPAEMQALITKLQSDLATLQTYTVTQVTQLHGDVSSLRNDLTGLQAGLSALQASLQAKIDSLTGQVGDLATQLTSALSQITAVGSSITTLTGDIAAIQAVLGNLTPGQLTTALANLATLQTTVSGLAGQLTSTQSQLGALTTTVNGITTTTIPTLQTQLGTLTTTVTTLTSKVNVICALPLIGGVCPS
jgi:peptidoglycan hydrolase CwlO-like protein